jgi:hypothetical protein
MSDYLAEKAITLEKRFTVFEPNAENLTIEN